MTQTTTSRRRIGAIGLYGSQIQSVSALCGTLRPASTSSELACDAYPNGIPDEILDNEVDDRKAVEGNKGLRFKPIRAFIDGDICRMMFGLST